MARVGSIPAGQTSFAWLQKLTLQELRHATRLIGAPSSGNKAVLSTHIERELRALSSTGTYHASKASPTSLVTKVSIISIDMGIRNLAYAHLETDLTDDDPFTPEGRSLTNSLPVLRAWKCLQISGSPESTEVKRFANGNGRKPKPEPGEDQLQVDTATQNGSLLFPSASFDPRTLAHHAYKFIKDILELHQPTHVLIERQRFRSAGGSAVQEWTIRVGMFEAMLHAVLETLCQEEGRGITVQPMDPARVSTHWLGERSKRGTGRTSGKEGKNAKIQIVGNSFSASQAAIVGLGLEPEEEVGTVVQSFLARQQKKSGARVDGKASTISKLDDFADCLLQGLAWIDWQAKRRSVAKYGLDALVDDPVFAKKARKDQTSTSTTFGNDTEASTSTADSVVGRGGRKEEENREPFQAPRCLPKSRKGSKIKNKST